MIDTLAPTNFPVGNPTVLKRAFESGGLSLMKGRATSAATCSPTVAHPDRLPPTSAPSGRTWRSPPGKVVLRNDLMELIQYAPSTAEVHEIPLLFSPPWINKY